ETLTDPSGQYFAPPGGNGNGDPNPPSCEQENDCGSGNSNYPTPQPPSPTPQPHAPGHGLTPPGQCPEGPGMCDGNSTSCNASHIGAMVCGTPSTGGQQPSGGCDAQCVANDKARIENYLNKQQALSNIKADAAQLVGDIFALLTDIFSENWIAVAFDLIASVIPHVANLINDIMIASGHSSPQLQQFMTFLQGMSDTLTFMKGFLFLLTGVGELMSPVLHQATKMVMSWVFSGLGSMWSGAWGATTVNPPDPNSMFAGKSSTQIQDLCIYYFGEGQGC
ncbi:MAG: hypothetical protein WCD86_18650, partial [Ktedonobacteraceae bacterium]